MSHHSTAPPLPKNIVIVGGIAGGASTAARARRWSEEANITLFDRGADISVGTCGMPYYIGREIATRDALVVVKPQTFTSWFDVNIRTQTEGNFLCG